MYIDVYTVFNILTNIYVCIYIYILPFINTKQLCGKIKKHFNRKQFKLLGHDFSNSPSSSLSHPQKLGPVQP